MHREVERIDLSQQTTQDYSVVIHNPPHEETDVEVGAGRVNVYVLMCGVSVHM